VAAWDITDAGAAALVGDIASAGGEGTFFAVNITDKASVERAVAEVIARWGRIDVLVNNAGIVRDAQLVKWKDGQIASLMTDEQFDAVVAVNLKGVFTCTRAVVPHMIRQNSGVILSASSVVGLYGNFGQTNYADLGARARPLQHPRQRRCSRIHRDGYPQGHAAEDPRRHGRAHADRADGRAA
jgi:3-oxoacyl-[acyl-carrier protein] reductase